MASRYEAETAYAYGDAEESKYGEERAIPSAVGKLDNAVEEMRELVSVMEKRLLSVLAPEQTTSAVGDNLKAVVRTQSDHAERLTHIAERVHESRSRLGNLLNRLDV